MSTFLEEGQLKFVPDLLGADPQLRLSLENRDFEVLLSCCLYHRVYNSHRLRCYKVKSIWGHKAAEGLTVWVSNLVPQPFALGVRPWPPNPKATGCKWSRLLEKLGNCATAFVFWTFWTLLFRSSHQMQSTGWFWCDEDASLGRFGGASWLTSPQSPVFQQATLCVAFALGVSGLTLEQRHHAWSAKGTNCWEEQMHSRTADQFWTSFVMLYISFDFEINKSPTKINSWSCCWTMARPLVAPGLLAQAQLWPVFFVSLWRKGKVTVEVNLHDDFA